MVGSERSDLEELIRQQTTPQHIAKRARIVLWSNSALYKLFDLIGHIDINQLLLRMQELFNAAAQYRPILLMNREPAPEIDERDLTYFSPEALGANQTKSEIAFAGGFVTGSGLSNKHAPEFAQINKAFRYGYKIMALQIKVRKIHFKEFFGINGLENFGWFFWGKWYVWMLKMDKDVSLFAMC